MAFNDSFPERPDRDYSSENESLEEFDINTKDARFSKVGSFAERRRSGVLNLLTSVSATYNGIR